MSGAPVCHYFTVPCFVFLSRLNWFLLLIILNFKKNFSLVLHHSCLLSSLLVSSISTKQDPETGYIPLSGFGTNCQDASSYFTSTLFSLFHYLFPSPNTRQYINGKVASSSYLLCCPHFCSPLGSFFFFFLISTPFPFHTSYASHLLFLWRLQLRKGNRLPVRRLGIDLIPGPLVEVSLGKTPNPI